MPARLAAKNRDKSGTYDNDGRLRRLAIQLAAQLPESPAEARIVLMLASELVEKFLAVREKGPVATIVDFTTGT